MKWGIVSIVASMLFSLLLITGYHFIVREKTGYVRTGVILTKYKYMHEVNQQFQQELAVVQANIDTLNNRYKQLKSKEGEFRNDKDKAEWGYKLGIAETEFLRYNQTAQEQMQQRQAVLTKQVLNKINAFIQDYGKENGYRTIFGTTNDGNILFAKEKDDLTDIILEKLNENYDKNKPKSNIDE